MLAVDQYDAYTTRSTFVYVEQASLSISDLQSVFSSKFAEANQSSSVDGSFQIINAVSSALNFVNCSISPNCSAIGRNECGEGDDHVCGECFDDYLGTPGYSNLACVSLQDSNSLKKSGESCTEDSDCLLSDCSSVTLKCVNPPLSCPSNCNNQGTCLYSDINGNDVDSCSVVDTFCSAACFCFSEFRGSDCGLSEDEFLQRQELRLTMMTAIASTAALQDLSADEITSQASTLNSIMSDSSEVSLDAVTIGLSMVSSLVQASLESSISEDAASNIITSMSQMLSVNGSKGSDSIVQSLSSTVDSLGDSVISGLVSGEDAVEIISDNLKMSISKVFADEAGNASLSPPLSQTEKLSGSVPSSISLPSSGLSGDEVGISVLGWGSNPYTDFQVDSLPIRLSTSTSTSRRRMSHTRKLTSAFNVTIVMQNSQSVGYVYNPPQQFNVTCTTGTYVEHTFNCSGDIRSFTCDGTESGSQTLTCPSLQTSPSCEFWNGTAYSDNHCEVTSYTSENTTCVCVISEQSYRRLSVAKGRNLEEMSSQTTEISSMTTSVATEFVSTWESSASLSLADVRKNIVVFVTISAVFFVAFFGGLYGVHLDNKDEAALMSKQLIRNHYELRNVTTALKKKVINA